MIGRNLLAKSISPFGAITNLSIENAKVLEGITYAISKRFSIPASTATIDVVLDPTACTCDKFIFLPVFMEAFGAGPIFVDFYVDPVYTLGDPIIPTNRDLTNPNPSAAVWTLNPTVSNPGTKTPSEFVIFSNGTAAVSKAGGSSKGDLVTNIDMTKKYMFRFACQEATIASAIITANWFEVPPL